jgi:hypothetical protein
MLPKKKLNGTNPDELARKFVSGVITIRSAMGPEG